MENFFSHLKEEVFHHVRYLNIDALATALDEYIHWYNHERISTKLEGLSPVQYRTQTLAAETPISPVQLPGPVHTR
ncbi:IS3 family transposase [Rhodococcus qingshengii]|uniref:IS3 family transposase n=1 Tax=Rhodococcus qingshengii TaxID=334542 RepID=UPI00202E299E|nr:IS3 family transposase [Rhodococcus qingshengii]